MPRPLWRQIHLASYGLFAFATLHALSAGTDVQSVLIGGLAIGVGATVALFALLSWVWRAEPRPGRVARGLPTSVPR
jgi:hypothetical protein